MFGASAEKHQIGATRKKLQQAMPSTGPIAARTMLRPIATSLPAMSLATVHSRALDGLAAAPVTVEVHLANGLPSFIIVGR